ncbi:MAG: aromatic amino acid ammonia-lyase, partial [Bacteroidota bacterium]
MKSFYTLQEAIEALQQPVELSVEVRERMDRSVAFLQSYLDKATSPVYGVNTGFGSLQNVEISREDLSALQENLLITHAAGVGKPLSFELVRNMLWLKMLNMSKGYSAIRPEIFEKLSAMYNQGWFPVVTEQGSLGASGDLAPLSQMVLPLIGKGYLRHPQHGEISGEQWLAQNNWKPLQLGPKEALGLINGTQFMLAHAVEAYRRIRQIFKQLPKVSALSIDAFDCRMDPFQSPIHRVRPHAGQIAAAAEIRAILEDSPIAKQPKKQVQDPYSFRCIPQVHGASYDALDHCLDV